MQFIDLKAQYQVIKEDIHHRIQTVLEHGQYIKGPEIQELEQKLVNFSGTKHCIAVASGTDALLIALMAVGIKAGDEIITSPFSFIATAEVVALLGAKPVFVDIDPKTYNLNPELIEAVITPKTRVILPVNIFGQCADYDKINAIANKHGLMVIEDAAQSFGASYKGRKSGGLGAIGCTSFFPSKPLGGYGEGGACFTSDDNLATIMRQIRDHGQDSHYHHARIGINGRLDSLQAAILLSKLTIFEKEMEKRQQLAKWYGQELHGKITTPYIEQHNISAWAQYTVQVDNREEVRKLLSETGIPTAVHYPIALHQQPAFKDLLGNTLPMPVSEKLVQRVLSLPFHPYLLPDQSITKRILAAHEMFAQA